MAGPGFSAATAAVRSPQWTPPTSIPAVGENSADVRGLAVAGLGFLGLAVDDHANRLGPGDRDISPEGSPARVLVVHAREDVEIADACRRLVAKK